MNEKFVFAKLLRNFTFELVPGHVVAKRLTAVMRATQGILMYAKRRQNVRLLDNDNIVTATKRFFFFVFFFLTSNFPQDNIVL